MNHLSIFMSLLLMSICIASQAQPTAPANDNTRPASAGAVRTTYNNPLFDCPGAADPAVLKYDGLYYLYPTLDCTGYDVWVSANLVNWERKPKCFTDPRGGIWAPDIFHNKRGDGRIYLYYTADNPGKGKVIGVAVGDHPLGPFKDVKNLFEDSIDAHMFQDDDGSFYLYYVDMRDGFKIMVQPMSDPVTKRGQAKKVIWPTEDWEKDGHVTEGPWMVKHMGKYYLMYSGSGAMGPTYAIGYATSDSPVGPFKKYENNPIAHRGNGVFGPGHHCVVEGPDGHLWMLYHQKNTENYDWDRFLALDPIWFDELGVMHAKTTRGTLEPGP